MTLVELADLGVADLLARFRSGDATPTQALESCLDRIEWLESQVNAVLTLLTARARERAAESDARWARGDPRPLEGIPYGLKDIIETAGIRTTGGPLVYREHVPSANAALVDRLEAAGAVLVAKLQTLEFAAGIRTHYGRTNNPWDLDRLAAGSSSGPAAALAARELPLTIGTDTGGSIAIPAAFNGVTGLKATFGRVPRHGVMPLSWTLDHVGPMTRSALDAALALQVMAGFDERDPSSSKAPVDDYTDGIERGVDGLRIGVATDWFFDVVDPQVADATHRAIDSLVGLGATRVAVSFPSKATAHPHAMEVFLYFPEAAVLHEVNDRRLDDYGEDFRILLEKVQFVHAIDYLKALRARNLVQRDFERAFEMCDVIIVPGCVSVAPRHDHLVAEIGDVEYELLDVVSRTTGIMNITGIPTLTVPSGLTRGRLPMGISIAARPFDEATIFRAAHTYQRVTDHHQILPPLLAQLEAKPLA